MQADLVGDEVRRGRRSLWEVLVGQSDGVVGGDHTAPRGKSASSTRVLPEPEG